MGGVNIPDTNCSTFIFTLYCPDQNFENESNMHSAIFDVFLINSVYIVLHTLT